MMTRLGACVVVLAILVAPLAQAESLAGFVARFDAYLEALDPIRAGQRGDRAALARWPDDSPQAVAARRARLQDFKRELEAFKTQKLKADDALNRDLIAQRLTIALEGLSFDEERRPFVFGEGFYTLADQTAEATKPTSLAEAEAWIARLEALPAYYDTQIANLRRGLATGFVQSRAIAAKAAEVTAARAKEPAQASYLLKPLADLPASIPKASADGLRQRALDVMASRVKPAQERLAAFLAETYLPATPLAPGLSAIPGGAAYYAYLVRFHTTTNLTPVQIHAQGEAEIARIGQAMDQLIAGLGEAGPRAQFLARLRADPRFHAASIEAYVEKTAEIAKRADAALPRFFATLPRLTYGVKRVPPELASTSGGYWPGSPDQGLAGAIIVHVDDLSQSPLYGLPAWVFHEGVPGHHLQIALAQERTDLPRFRRNDDITAFVEGWALYSEGLADEMGLYRDPYEQLGRLSLDMWRACRLVMDTGLHVMGWTRDQARACLADNTGLSLSAIDFETDRYIGWPGQALAYKIGHLRIQAIRRAAEARLGQRFDLRRFHDALLRDGPLPLDILERRMAAWGG